MKKLFFSFLTISVVSFSNAQNLQFDWADVGGAGADSDFTSDISSCPDGSVVVCGAYSGTIDFDYGTGIDNRTSFGFQDCFIQKLDPQGNALWTADFGSPFGDYAWSVEADEVGDIYTTGTFFGTVDFDPGASVMNLITSTQSVFLQKLDEDGNLIWAFNIEGNAHESRLKIDKDGYILLSGYFNGTIDLDPSAGVTSFTAPVNPHGFLAKYDGASNLIWAKELNASNYIYINGLESDETGDIYIGGYFEGDVDMDPSGVTNFLTASFGNSNSYVAKYNSSGNLIWAKNFLGTGNYAFTMTLDKWGNSYSTGEFYGTVDFDPNAGISNKISIYSDLFLVKLDKDGNLSWVNSIGGSDAEVTGYAIDTDEMGNVYFTGTLADTADFDSGVGIYNVACGNIGATNIFLSKLSSDGEFDYVFTNPGDNYSGMNAICLSADGSIYGAGSYQGTIDFDPSLAVFSSTSSGVPEDYFILKYTCNVDTSVTNLNGTFTSNQIGGIYQWIDCATNLEIVGETNSSFSPTANGTYCVIVSNGECVGKSAPISISDVGIETNSLATINIYPNPTNNQTVITSNENIKYFVIADLSGKIILKQEVNSTNFAINMSEFANGIYVLNTTSETGLFVSSKIVKQ